MTGLVADLAVHACELKLCFDQCGEVFIVLGNQDERFWVLAHDI
jgi:hypothetical protein